MFCDTQHCDIFKIIYFSAIINATFSSYFVSIQTYNYMLIFPFIICNMLFSVQKLDFNIK